MKTAEHTIRERQAHHKALADLAKSMGVEDPNGLQLWRSLRRIEQEANRRACDYCNGDIDLEQWEVVKEKTTEAVKRVFGGHLPKGFFVNGDPRGYTLKLEEESAPFPLHEDWGRYQILAPEIN